MDFPEDQFLVGSLIHVEDDSNFCPKPNPSNISYFIFTIVMFRTYNIVNERVKIALDTMYVYFEVFFYIFVYTLTAVFVLYCIP